jgi:hypothetical protein
MGHDNGGKWPIARVGVEQPASQSSSFGIEFDVLTHMQASSSEQIFGVLTTTELSLEQLKNGLCMLRATFSVRGSRSVPAPP